MATSPNYAWAEPDNSSLVKNGAQDIRVLGDAIDTSVWNVGYGQAGKNKIINGDFSINQRAFTSTTTTATFGFDRFELTAVDGTTTYSAQTFTPGAAPVAGYESKNYARLVSTGQTATSAISRLHQRIEDVRTFAGQTATISFYAQAGTGTPKIAIEMVQNFGSGGSPSAAVNTNAGQVTLSTSFARYSVTVAIPSISGKTIGTTANTSYLQTSLFVSAGSDFNARTGSLGIQSNTFNIWGVQVEYGSKATPFQTASGGSPQSELAMCQRYYQRFSAVAANYYIGGRGNAALTTSCIMQFAPLETMRTTPTILDYSNLAIYDEVTAPLVSVATIAPLANSNLLQAAFTSTGLTQFRNYTTVSGSTTAGFIGFSAEL
jgi:hypothetical protein